ncbi:MAG TPA: cobyrinate a,c-diamide synthase [Terriglobales bacterium]|nr:cobyrinate a,c-diamide synthase [Terriglobales bacterium]
MRAFVIAGTHSGVGKTTLTRALIAGLRARGLRVRAFKVGPDFLDPMHLAQASGGECLNLDGWMLGRECCRARLQAAAAASDVAVVEGMMGLYDGLSGASEAGSTAEMAKWLGLPVVLLADASGGARSLAATVLGFQRFDPELALRGVVFNRIGGPGHLQYLREAMQSAALWGRPVPRVEPPGPAGIALLGGLPADESLHIPERHLGLATPASAATLPPDAAWAEAHLDLDALLALAAEVAPPAAIAAPRAAPLPPPRLRLGVARDQAFCFYYPDNLERLRAAGLELVEFSPLRELTLPARVSGLYFGGGYPELHAAALSANAPMRQAVAAFAAAGGFIYAECGGLMYLARSLDGAPMAGVLPTAVAMQPRLQAIGYREVCPVGLGAPPALRARGHEFHYSRLVGAAAAAPAHRDPSGQPEGFHLHNVVASYIHLHFASCPALPGLLAEAVAGSPLPAARRAE